MEFKDYQRRVLERFDNYVSSLSSEQNKAVAAIQALIEAGIEIPDGMSEWPKNAWKKIETLLPRVRTSSGLVLPPYTARHDSRGRSIPHACLKVPTGGGKTLLAAACMGHLHTDFFKRQTGLILWLVPTKQIYAQTRKALFDRLHPYRQQLERASGGRVKVLEKDDAFNKNDTENYLCIMLVRLAATNRTNNKEFLRIFRDAGRYTSFFPEVDDYQANIELMNTHPDLECPNFDEIDNFDKIANIDQIGSIPKHSLVNVFKMIRPAIVIDEGHKAYSENTRNSLNAFNPSFILELTATPNGSGHISNVLVDVSGMDLKDEQMIKLPINIINTQRGDWKHTLTQSHARLSDLSAKADKLQSKDGRYIRPIMVIRVERTGKDQRDGKKIHAEDAREYLIERLSVRPDEIRIKSSEKDELKDTDLFDPLCPVRYVITKEALQEGWDCSFAYVLTLLDKTTAQTAMTQMIGRVLRQPDTRSTSIDELNQCYVFCYDQNVSTAVANVRKGLEEEGMTGLSEFVRAEGGNATDDPDGAQLQLIPRRKQFSDLKIFLPRVLHKHGNSWREINYDRDVLAYLPWEKLSYDVKDFFDTKGAPLTTETAIDVQHSPDLTGQLDFAPSPSKKVEAWVEKRLDLSFLSRPLLDIVPNPWQASRIWIETIDGLNDKGWDEERIYNNRLYLLESIKRYLKEQTHKLSEEIFRQKLKAGEIVFRLATNGNQHLNFEIAKELQALARKKEKKLIRENNDPIQNSLFEVVFDKDLNNLERDFALYLADHDAVHWWHRMVSRQEYGLQGWQRNKIYPDFIACLNKNRLLVLETKGLQLKGNDDTEYKSRLFDLFTTHYEEAKTGVLELGEEAKVSLHMMLEDNWHDEANTLFGVRHA